MKENNLPEGWRWVKLGEVCNKIGDIDHKMPKQLSAGYPYVSTKDFTDDLKISFDHAKYISQEDYLNLSRKIKPEKGDIIFPRYGTIGKNILIDFDKEFLVSYSCAVIKPNHNLVISKYVYLFSLSPLIGKEIKKYTVETTQANVGIASIKSFVFPLPPISIQQAIVSKIEELFSELDKSIETLRLAQQQLKTYRQAVLKWAFEGKLTETSTIWKNVRLGDVANAIDPQPSHRTPPIVPDGVPFVSIKDFNYELDKIDFAYARRVSKSVLEEHIERYELEAGDFVIGKIGTIGKPVRTVLPQNYCLSANIVLIQPRKINPTYLYYFFQSSLIEKAFTAGVKATTQAAFGIQKVRELRIELPNDEEQQQVTQEIESRLSVADKMEESITQSLQQAEVLRQSILMKSFEGMLLIK